MKPKDLVFNFWKWKEIWDVNLHKARSLVVLGNQKFLVRVRLLPMCRGELSAVIARLMSKCLWSDWKWLWGVKEMPSPFPCSLVIHEWLWKETHIEKKSSLKQMNSKSELYFSYETKNIIYKYCPYNRRRRVKQGVLVKRSFFYSVEQKKKIYIVSQTFVTLNQLTKNIRPYK